MAAYVFGAGAHGRVVLDILKEQGGWSSIQFLDEDSKLAGTTINGATVAGDLELLKTLEKDSCGVVIALGHPLARETIAKRVSSTGIDLLNAIHPSAVIADSAKIGRGNMICVMSVINSDADLGHNIIVNSNVVIEHDCKIGDFASISTGAQIGGRCVIGERAFIGTGAIVVGKLRIGAGAIVGAGALILRDVPDNAVVFGSPARIIKTVDPEIDYKRLF